jgi:hypothetical protein
LAVAAADEHGIARPRVGVGLIVASRVRDPTLNLRPVPRRAVQIPEPLGATLPPQVATIRLEHRVANHPRGLAHRDRWPSIERDKPKPFTVIGLSSR